MPGVVSGLNSVELSISGSNLGAYKYKAAISEADCKSQASYQTTADLNPVIIDVSSFVDGEVHICATAISPSGYEQDSSQQVVFPSRGILLVVMLLVMVVARPL